MILVHVAAVKSTSIVMGNSKPLIEVALGVLINGSNELLLSRRPDHGFMSGYWEFPGGKLEPGEAPIDALVRELSEELDITFQLPEYIDVFSHEYPDRHVKLHVWKIKNFSPTPRGAEGQVTRWLSLKDLENLPLLEGSRVILPRLI